MLASVQWLTIWADLNVAGAQCFGRSQEKPNGKATVQKYGTVQANNRDNNRQACILMAPMAGVLP